jgi:hypothetical protein
VRWLRSRPLGSSAGQLASRRRCRRRGCCGPLHTKPSSIACEPCRLKRQIAEGAQAVPALFPVDPVPERPVFCCRACDNQVEAAAVGVLARPCLTFDVEWFQFPSHDILRSKRPPNPRSQATVSARIGENTAELRSTVLRRNTLLLLCIPNGGEQGRTLYWRKGCP